MKIISRLIILATLVIGFGCGSGDNHNKIDASGTIEATNVTVSAKVSGQVKKLFFNEGDKVNAGDTLLTIDHDLLSIQLQQAEAGADAAGAQLALLKQGARAEDIKQAEDAVKQAKANFELAESTMKRNEKLYKSNSITKQQWDDVLAKYDIANAQLNSSKENLKKIKNLARPEEIKQAEANLDRQKASVNLLKKNISDSFVTAPINGFVVKKFVEAGESVAPLSSLVMISNLNYVDLVIYIPETDLGKVKLGQEASVQVDTYPNRSFNGKVIYISPEAEFTPKNIQTKDERTKLVYAVKIHIPNSDYSLKDGMPADAEILIK
ncbi:MAG: efflux RND transporter periplasmic adaptor subunit [Bacteroidetes bacterium]|nr:efflux RND transporter periplasmic adaptor subunit [Bacteroidota bacterium]